MSVELEVYLNRSSLPSVQKWNKALKELGFPLKLDETIDLGTHLVVHAGLRPGIELYSQTTEDMTELRSLGEDRTGGEALIQHFWQFTDEKASCNNRDITHEISRTDVDPTTCEPPADSDQFHLFSRFV